MGNFSFEHAQGAPLVAAIIVTIAILFLAGATFFFKGSVQF